MMAAHATAVNVTGTGTVHTGAGTFRGLALFSTAGATVVVYDGTSAAGTILAKFVLAPNASKEIDIADGVRCGIGIHVTATAAVEGSVRLG